MNLKMKVFAAWMIAVYLWTWYLAIWSVRQAFEDKGIQQEYHQNSRYSDKGKTKEVNGFFNSETDTVFVHDYDYAHTVINVPTIELLLMYNKPAVEFKSNLIFRIVKIQNMNIIEPEYFAVLTIFSYSGPFEQNTFQTDVMFSLSQSDSMLYSNFNPAQNEKEWTVTIIDKFGKL